MWIRRTDDGQLINLKDCVDIKTNNTTDHIYFERTKGSCFSISFDTQENRDNFYEHIVAYLKPHEIDPNKKLLKL